MCWLFFITPLILLDIYRIVKVLEQKHTHMACLVIICNQIFSTWLSFFFLPSFALFDYANGMQFLLNRTNWPDRPFHDYRITSKWMAHQGKFTIIYKHRKRLIDSNIYIWINERMNEQTNEWWWWWCMCVFTCVQNTNDIRNSCDDGSN